MLFSRTQSETQATYGRTLVSLVEQFMDHKRRVDNFSAMMAAYASGNAVPPELLPSVPPILEEQAELTGRMIDLAPVIPDLEIRQMSPVTYQEALVNNPAFDDYKATSMLPNPAAAGWLMGDILAMFKISSSSLSVYDWIVPLKKKNGLYPSDGELIVGTSGSVLDSAVGSDFLGAFGFVVGIQSLAVNGIYPRTAQYVVMKSPHTTALHNYAASSLGGYVTGSANLAYYFAFQALVDKAMPYLLSAFAFDPANTKAITTNLPELSFSNTGTVSTTPLNDAILEQVEPFKSITNFINGVTFSE